WSVERSRPPANSSHVPISLRSVDERAGLADRTRLTVGEGLASSQALGGWSRDLARGRADLDHHRLVQREGVRLGGPHRGTRSVCSSHVPTAAPRARVLLLVRPEPRWTAGWPLVQRREERRGRRPQCSQAVAGRTGRYRAPLSLASLSLPPSRFDGD